MPTNTLLIQGRTSLNAATLIVAAGDGPTLINNNGPNTLFVGDNDSIASTDGYGITSIAAGGFFSVDGEHDLFATIATGLPTTISLIRGGLNFFSLTKLIILQTGAVGTGFFVYNGIPAFGNPPILSIVAPGQTVDPFGNPTKAVMNIGNFSAAHIGWDANGNTFVSDTTGNTRILITGGGGGVWQGGTDPAVVFYNSFGAVILVVDPQRGGTFQYQDNNSAVQGVLIGAQVGKNTTDPINGTTVGAGVNLIDPAFGDSVTLVGANIAIKQVLFTVQAIVTANTGSGATSPFTHIAGPEQGHAGHGVFRVLGTSADGTVPGGIIASLTDPPVRAMTVLAELQGAIGMLGVAPPTAPPAGNGILFPDVNGFLRWLSGLPGDTNVYFAAFLMLSGTSMPQTIATTTFTNINNCAFPVGIGKYAFRARLTYSGGTAAGNMKIQFAGPATSSRWMNGSFEDNLGFVIGDAQNGALGFITSPTLNTTARNVCDMEGEAVFTAAGTLTVQAAEGTSGDTVIIEQIHFWLYPLA